MSSRLSPCLAVVALLAIAAYTLYRTRAEHRVEIPPVRELAVAVQAAAASGSCMQRRQLQL